MLTPEGKPIRMDNISSFAYVGVNITETPSELFLAYHPANISDLDPINPKELTIIKSAQTDLWCRLAELPDDSSQIGLTCDLDSPENASVLTYTGVGLEQDGIPMVVPGGNGTTLVLKNTTNTTEGEEPSEELALLPLYRGRAATAR